MKFSTQVLADGLIAEVKALIAREIAEAKSTTADASRVADLQARVRELELRLEALERKGAPAKAVKLWA